jgi:hypothetical protein
VEIARIGGPEDGASAAAVQVAPSTEGAAEMLPSAPLAIPPTGASQSGHQA